MPMVQFGEWLPDSPDYGSAGATEAQNVYPRTDRSYGPWPDLSAYSSALTARCQGAAFATARDATVNAFAGDATKLYRMQSGSATWTDSSGTTYTTGADERWTFCLYNKNFIATNYSDPIQKLDITSGLGTAFSNLLSSGPQPKARYCAVVRNFVMLGNTTDTTDGAVPNRVWWSSIDDPTNFYALGSSNAANTQSDAQNLEGDGGWVQGVVGGLSGADCAIFLERRIVRGTYIGSPAVFQFDRVEGARGTPAPGSICQLGGTVFYLGEDGFYAFDGANSRPIGSGKVDKTLFAEIDNTYINRISSAIDPLNKLVVWAIPVSGNSGGNPNKLYIYNWETDRWSYASQNVEVLARTLAFGYSLDSLDTLSSSLDALPFSLDSRAYAGGKLLLSAFDTLHKLNYFTGSNLASVMDTAEFSADGKRMFARGFRPIVQGTSATITGSVRYRDLLTSTLMTSTAQGVGVNGMIPARVDARYMRARVNIAAGGTWTHAIGVEPDTVPVGKR